MTVQNTPGPIALARENGKRITVDGRFGGSAPHLERVLVIVWPRNGAPLLPLDLNVDEAEKLVVALRAAIGTAAG